MMIITFLTNLVEALVCNACVSRGSKRFKNSHSVFTIYTSTNLSLVYIGAWYIGTGRSAAVNVRQSLGQRQGGGWTTLKRSHHLKNILLRPASMKESVHCRIVFPDGFSNVTSHEFQFVWKYTVFIQKLQLRIRS